MELSVNIIQTNLQECSAHTYVCIHKHIGKHVRIDTYKYVRVYGRTDGWIVRTYIRVHTCMYPHARTYVLVCARDVCK